MKVGMFIGKVKKFGISWCIPHRMTADNGKPHLIDHSNFGTVSGFQENIVTHKCK